MAVEIVYGNSPKPDVEVRLADKRWDGAGHTVLAQSRLAIGLIGPCDHQTAGHGSLDFYHGFVSYGGERHDDALWDYTIAQNGDAMMLNDPLGYRMPWANGGTDGLEGGGPALIAQIGASRLNAKLFSKEHVILGREAWSEAMLKKSVEIDVYHLDHHAKVPYTTYPRHPTLPVDADYQHGEFTGKGGNALDECAGAWRKQHEARKQAMVAEQLRYYQRKGTGPDPAPPPPPKPPSIYPPGKDEAWADHRFGRLRRHHRDGTETYHGFNPKGLISLMWLRRGKETDSYPQAQDHYYIHDNRGGPERKYLTGEVVTFEDGSVLMTHAARDGWFWA